jgi:hypothetical protein
MQDIVYYRALEAFCRQRAQIENESEAFWLLEAKQWILKREKLFTDPVVKEKSLPEEAA